MKWNVFNRNDEETWPTLNCPILVSKSTNSFPQVYQWDKNNNLFINNNEVYKPHICFYQYITHLPYIAQESYVMKCKIYDTRCDYEDDGYCLNKEQCKYKQKTTEYLLSYKSYFKEV